MARPDCRQQRNWQQDSLKTRRQGQLGRVSYYHGSLGLRQVDSAAVLNWPAQSPQRIQGAWKGIIEFDADNHKRYTLWAEPVQQVRCLRQTG